MTEHWTGGQYSIYRALLGAFLLVHFALLLPYGPEVFGADGTVASAALSPLIGVLPNPLAYIDTPVVVTVLLSLGAACGLAIACGWWDRVAAALAALSLGWLYQRNPLIANPSLPLLGWLLVLHLFVPPRPFGSLAARRAGGPGPAWRMPSHLFVAAWIVLALSYSYSGYTKLFSPAWTDGETIRLVLENPLARDHALRTLVLQLPPAALQWVTWILLWLELLFAPLALIPRLRPILWTAMLAAQIGFLCFLNFADLTAPMLLAHLITFDPAWVRRASRQSPALLLFDGECAFCHATVRLAATEDQHRRLRFAPLSSDVAAAALAHRRVESAGDTIVLVDAEGCATRSRAVSGVLERLGGLWLLPALLLRTTPRWLADFGYDLVGRIRYRLAGRVAPAACPALTLAWADLDVLGEINATPPAAPPAPRRSP